MSNVSDNWKTISSKKVLITPRFEVVEDEVIQPDGLSAVYHVVRRNPFCIIIPLHDGGKVTLVRQYRYMVKAISLEFPMGTTDSHDPESIAQKELVEETGLRAGNLIKLGEYWPGVGSVDQKAYCYLAQNLIQDTPQPEKGEFFDIETYTIDDVAALIKTGVIRDAQTIVAYNMLLNYLSNK